MGISSVSNYLVGRPPKYQSAFVLQADWSKIPHKGMKALPQAEIRQRVKELAVDLAWADSEAEKQKISDEVQEMFLQYESHVSPDRKNIFKEALNTIKRESAREGKPEAAQEPRNVFDALNDRDGVGRFKDKEKGMRFDTPYAIDGGGTVTAGYVTGGFVNFDIEYKGEQVMSFQNGGRGAGVFYTRTAAEQAEAKEIFKIYLSALDGARMMRAAGREKPDMSPKTDVGLDITV